MKKYLIPCFTVLISLMFSSAVLAKKPTPPPVPPPSEAQGVINACYKKMNGQLRILSEGGSCLPSELAISWNAAGEQGPAGPSGVVATFTLSGSVDAIPGTATEWVFAGPTATATTEESQRLTGVAGASLGTSASDAATFLYDLCFRAGGTTDALTNFAGANASAGQAITPVPFTAAGSVVPGAGTWEVGFCVLNSGASSLDANDFLNGWVMVTN